MSKVAVDKVVIHTDGSCLGNRGSDPGGFCAIVHYMKNGKVVKEEITRGGDPETTNNAMELRACIAGLRIVETPMDVEIILNSDSEYVTKGITQWLRGWKKDNKWKNANGKPVKNRKLWETLDILNSKFKITWTWVKAHNGNKYNELADTIAKEEATAAKRNRENTNNEEKSVNRKRKEVDPDLLKIITKIKPEVMKDNEFMDELRNLTPDEVRSFVSRLITDIIGSKSRKTA